MAKGKMAKFAEIKKMPHVFENRIWTDPVLYNHEGWVIDLQGRWQSHYFGNQNPIILELACGYGEYTVAIAQMYPEKNAIGVDIKGNRVWTGATYVQHQQLKNAAFVRAPIELLGHFFGASEISEIWLTFPDPQAGKPRKRLTALSFLQLYQKILHPNGIVHLKTDSDLLYEFTLETLAENNFPILVNYPDLYRNLPADNPLLSVSTRYEKLNLSGANTIKYLQFGLNEQATDET